MRRRKRIGALLAIFLVLTVAPATLPRTAPRAAAMVPVATNDATYTALGRVFPDPHGCVRGAPGASPWAKGRACAVQFIQWDEALAGLGYLESRYPRFVDLINLRELVTKEPELGEEMLTAGLPRPDLTRDRVPLYVVKLTDRDSPVPEKQRRRFAYSLSIHGIERAGLEGGLRAAEDLATWAAEEPAKRILEPTNDGPTAKQVLENAVIYFVLSNPDGWRRGDVTKGGVFYQRYNGNGMDPNRDWPAEGYAQPEYTPASEPEIRGYASYLKREAQRAGGRFAGGIDLHGMVTANALSFTMVGGASHDYRENAHTVETAIRTFRDAERRLIWSPYVAPAGECPGPVTEPAYGGRFPMCTDQWGTVWDTINYTTTGSFGDWMDADLGLGAVGLSNEMALSHLAPDTVFEPSLEQLHIDGNKGLIYSQLAGLLFEQAVTYVPGGRVAYVPSPARVRNAGGGTPSPLRGLAPQTPISTTEIGGRGFEFEVLGPNRGMHNGSLTVEATFANAGGVSPDTLYTSLILDRFGTEHEGDSEDWHEVARYFNQSNVYLQGGARIDLNDPKPGRYRIRPGTRTVVTKIDVRFGRGPSYSLPAQAPYDVANTDFYSDLNQYVPDGQKLQPLTAADILRKASSLDRLDSLVLTDDPAPAVPAPRRAEWFRALKRFVESGGNLVLTDGAMRALGDLGVVAPEAVRGGVFYAGWIDFDDGAGETYSRHHLAKSVDKEGTSEGRATLASTLYQHRHQTYEPAAIGYFVSPSGSANASCSADICDSPLWTVEPEAWRKAGGTVAGRSYARPGELGPGGDGISLGELPVGKGKIRIIGALLPQPSERRYHPYGLAAHALTYTGYQLVENALIHRRVAPVTPERPPRLPKTLSD